VRLRVAEVQRVHDHADVSGVLAGHPQVRDLDQFEGCLVHRCLELAVALPVAIGLLHHDAALEQQAFEHLADVELAVAGVLDAEGHVLEVAEHGHVLRVVPVRCQVHSSVEGRRGAANTGTIRDPRP
jgi:hypothetical protein